MLALEQVGSSGTLTVRRFALKVAHCTPIVKRLGKVFVSPNLYRVLVLGLLLIELSACSTYTIKHLAKTDINMVIDLHRHALDEHIYTLMSKLYLRNPRELRKTPGASIASQQARLAALIVKEQPIEVGGLEAVQMLKLGFDPSFSGDRVFQLMAGLMSMIHKSYGYQSDFYLFDKVDQQKLYLSARNVEVFSWRLRNSKDSKQQPLLLTVQSKTQPLNLSFERLLGKMIAHQDMMALIASDGNKRAINTVAQGVISVVFFPI